MIAYNQVVSFWGAAPLPTASSRGKETKQPWLGSWRNCTGSPKITGDYFNWNLWALQSSCGNNQQQQTAKAVCLCFPRWVPPARVKLLGWCEGPTWGIGHLGIFGSAKIDLQWCFFMREHKGFTWEWKKLAQQWSVHTFMRFFILNKQKWFHSCV